MNSFIKEFFINLFKAKKIKMPSLSPTDLRYNPLSIDEDIFIPVRGGELSLMKDSERFTMDRYLHKPYSVKELLEQDQRITVMMKNINWV